MTDALRELLREIGARLRSESDWSPAAHWAIDAIDAALAQQPEPFCYALTLNGVLCDGDNVVSTEAKYLQVDSMQDYAAPNEKYEATALYAAPPSAATLIAEKERLVEEVRHLSAECERNQGLLADAMSAHTHCPHCNPCRFADKIAEKNAEIERLKAGHWLEKKLLTHGDVDDSPQSCLCCGRIGEPAAWPIDMPRVYVCKSCKASVQRAEAAEVDAKNWMEAVDREMKRREAAERALAARRPIVRHVTAELPDGNLLALRISHIEGDWTGVGVFIEGVPVLAENAGQIKDGNATAYAVRFVGNLTDVLMWELPKDIPGLAIGTRVAFYRELFSGPTRMASDHERGG